MGIGFAYDFGSDAQRAAVKDWEYWLDNRAERLRQAVRILEEERDAITEGINSQIAEIKRELSRLEKEIETCAA